MKLKHYLSIFVIAATIGYGCKGDTGEAGPQGDPGLNGVSNMTISTYIIPFTSWTQYNSNTWYVGTNSYIPLTDAVNVYVSLTGQTYTPLATSGFFASGDNLTYVFGQVPGGATGSLTLWEYFNTVGPNVAVYVEVADIPPSLYVKYPKMNWNNYSEVSQLPEFKAALSKAALTKVTPPAAK
jgi:hypothetical protein